MSENSYDFGVMRREMVRDQLLRRDIKDKKVLDAFEKVPRHKFVDPKFHKDAYSDFPLSTSGGQTISQPYIIALMIQLLDIQKNDRVLEIGTGSGYQTAILAELGRDIFTVERIADLAEKAQTILKELEYKNIHINVADGTMGWKEFAPFNKIIVSAGSLNVPEPILQQLAIGGKLVIPIGQKFSQKLMLIEKDELGISQKDICGCIFVPLIGKYGWQA